GWTIDSKPCSFRKAATPASGSCGFPIGAPMTETLSATVTTSRTRRAPSSTRKEVTPHSECTQPHHQRKRQPTCDRAAHGAVQDVVGVGFDSDQCNAGHVDGDDAAGGQQAPEQVGARPHPVEPPGEEHPAEDRERYVGE